MKYKVYFDCEVEGDSIIEANSERQAEDFLESAWHGHRDELIEYDEKFHAIAVPLEEVEDGN